MRTAQLCAMLLFAMIAFAACFATHLGSDAADPEGLAVELPVAAEEPSHRFSEPAGLDMSIDNGWYRMIAARLACEEYNPTASVQGLQAPNRAQNLRTYFREHEIEIVPRDAEAQQTWRFAWQTTRFGRVNALRSVGPTSPEPSGSRVTYRREAFDEWYDNSSKGLEQGFTVHDRPGGEGPLCLAGHLTGLLRAELRTEGAVDLLDEKGAIVLRYDGLRVWDARGNELPARLQLDGMKLAILVEDRGAEYPLVVDPLLTSPAWTSEGDQPGAEFGISVATAGDVNGDGYSDVIIGAPGYDNGEAGEGRAFIFHGSSAGLSAMPAWVDESDQVDAAFGTWVATAGDVNADGFSDIIVGAPLADDGELDEGRAFVFHGSAAGVAATPAWSAEGDQAVAAFGFCVAMAGDVNGDSFSDVIVGAHLADGGELDEGRAFVYHGSAAGLATTPNWTTETNQDGAGFSFSVATAGDVNGDGFSDVIVGAHLADNGELDEGRAFVYHGSAAGLATTPAWSAETNQDSAGFGSSVATAGDVNGDGFSDVIVGAHLADNGELDEGRAFVYHGSASGLVATAAWAAESNQAGAAFGASVATAGDVNGDGFADIIVGSHLHDDGELDEGWAAVYQGSASGLAATPVWIAQSDQLAASFGKSVATAGDVNGDGFSDVVVGAQLYDNGENDEGRAFVFQGSASGLATTAAWTVESNQAEAQLGDSVASARDVNGDGFSDVIVGVRFYDNGQRNEGRAYVFHGSAGGLSTNPVWTAESDQIDAYFGSSVATAGDVNGDGFSDIIVSAPQYDNPPLPTVGRVYVYHGSAAGLPALPSWIAEGDQGDAEFGTRVATAGDVNGDGFSDVIIGDRWYENGQGVEGGRAVVYHGSEAGLATTPAWTAESDQDAAHLGFSVGTAGDVNADGFSDVIVSAFRYSNPEQWEGRVFVYHGSAVGLAASPAWVTEGNQETAYYGHSVATVGDVNGDGFSDVVVGALGISNGQGGEGAAFVYHGSPLGLSTTAAWSFESNVVGAQFGFSVASAGDLDSDGYSDLIVGAPAYNLNRGAAYVFHGSTTGLSNAISWFAEANNNAHFGYSVASAGDVTGDGFCDVIVGAPLYDTSNEGWAFAFYGNASDGLDRIPRQRQADDSAPIDLLGRSETGTSLRLAALGRTAAGRDRVRLECEVKPLGVPLDGTGLAIGLMADTGTPGGSGSSVPLTHQIGGLSSDTPFHWRLRIASSSPFFPWSPWLTLPYNNRTETDVRTSVGTTGLEVSGVSEARLFLEPARPNPLTSRTELSYKLPRSGRMRLAVYDVMGRERALLVEAVQTAGIQTVSWDGTDSRGKPIPSGVYFIHLDFEGHTDTQKILLAR